MNYRTDIDGLRAIAVWLVIIFHFFDTDKFNGFIGVDIFFVISGFLITKILIQSLEQGTFSLIDFYDRRARRILPALTIVMATCICVGYAMLLPSEQLPFFKSIVTTSLFSSNFLFWSEAGYFDVSAALKPLLHTWSLAIEEQFYILFPVLLFLTSKLSKTKLNIAIISLFLISFIANIYLISNGEQSTAFFMPFTRAWELLAGSIIALNIIKPINNNKIIKHISYLGLALIIIGVLIPIEKEQFPGFFALFPVLGASAIIYSGQQSTPSAIETALSQKHLVFMGKISYSLYLWHWPIYVFTSYYWINELSTLTIILLMALCTALSYLSWKYVEQPFRHKTTFKKTSTIFALSITSICFFTILGSAQYKNIKNKEELLKSNKPVKEIAFKRVNISDFNITVRASKNTTNTQSNASENERTASFAIWGDSHAIALSAAIAKIAANSETSSILIAKNDFLVPSELCGIIKHKKECLEKTDEELQYIIDHPSLKTVVLAHRWDAWVNGWAKKIPTNEAYNLRYQSLESIIQSIENSGKNTIIFMQIPEIRSVPINQSITSLHARIERLKTNIELRPKVEEYLEHTKTIRKVMEDLSKNTNVTIIWPHDFLCDDQHCKMMEEDKILYKDDDHLSYDGAMYTVKFISQYLNSDLSSN